MFTQLFVQAYIKQNIKALRHWSLCHKGPVTRKCFHLMTSPWRTYIWFCFTFSAQNLIIRTETVTVFSYDFLTKICHLQMNISEYIYKPQMINPKKKTILPNAWPQLTPYLVMWRHSFQQPRWFKIQFSIGTGKFYQWHKKQKVTKHMHIHKHKTRNVELI